jgi:hypothetical protein
LGRVDLLSALAIELCAEELSPVKYLNRAPKAVKSLLKQAEHCALPDFQFRQRGLSVRAHGAITCALSEKGIEFDGTPECAKSGISLEDVATAANCGVKTLAEVRAFLTQ